MKAVYPGSFDPITLGHLDVIHRAADIMDELVIAIMHNPWKKSTFTVFERIEMIKEAVKDIPNVKVVTGDGFTVNLAQKENARILIRGIRAVMDYENELQTATANQMLNPQVETLFLVSRPTYSFISSSTVKEIAMNHGDVSRLVPKNVELKLIEKYGIKHD